MATCLLSLGVELFHLYVASSNDDSAYLLHLL